MRYIELDPVIGLAPAPDITDDWSNYLESGLRETDSALVEQHLRTGAMSQ